MKQNSIQEKTLTAHKVVASTSRSGMREKIKQVATKLLIKHGVHGTSFRDIANDCDITTTNIHYHFGSKQKLVEEVLQEYVDAATTRHRSIWFDNSLTIQEKLRKVLAYNHERYRQFNRGRQQGRPWSLIGRLRLDSGVLSPAARESLSTFTDSVHEAVKAAFLNAVESGEIPPEAPLADLALLVMNLVNSSSVFTQDAGSFERLEQFFGAFERVIVDLYLTRSKGTSPTK